jgi:hypothetical protein
LAEPATLRGVEGSVSRSSKARVPCSCPVHAEPRRARLGHSGRRRHAGAAAAQSSVHVVVAFDGSKGQSPEGLAIAHDGTCSSTGNGSLGLNLGANGIAIQRGVLTVTNTERRTVVQIPEVGDQPGAISLLASLPAGDSPDGVPMDVFGDAFVAMNLANAIAKVTPSGSMQVVASGDPVDFPSSVVFGTARGYRTSIFGVNLSISELFGLPSGQGPGVYVFNAGVPG